MTTKSVTYRLPEQLIARIDAAVEKLQQQQNYGRVTKNSFVVGAIERACDEVLKEESRVKTEKISAYIEGLKVDLQFNKVVRIDSFEDETGATEQDLFAALDAAGIEYTKPGGTYGDEHGQIKQVPDDCIYCDQFYIKE